MGQVPFLKDSRPTMEEMSDTRTMREMLVLAAVVAGGCGGHGQVFSSPLAGQKSSAATPLNAANSASAPVVDSSAAGLPRTAAPAQRPAKRAEIGYANSLLTVKAENSSLNQILREIGRRTGIKITGGVAEERVFGIYGPASTAEVLNHLLDGTGSNMMLLATEAGAPGELILTPRLGGPTPPNPNAKGFDDDSGEDGDDAPRRQPQPRGVTLFGGSTPTEAPPAAAVPSAPPISPAGADANGSAPPVNQQSPNGVKTPQEIYQQLQQLRQQQQQQQQAEPPQ